MDMPSMTDPTRNSLHVGDLAPDFALRSQTGQVVPLYEILERDAVVLYFYLRDATPG